MQSEIELYHEKLSPEDKAIADLLYLEIYKSLPEAENKIWHAHLVWFLDGNPVVGYCFGADKLLRRADCRMKEVSRLQKED
jgi:hypothetical protein